LKFGTNHFSTAGNTNDSSFQPATANSLLAPEVSEDQRAVTESAIATIFSRLDLDENLGTAIHFDGPDQAKVYQFDEFDNTVTEIDIANQTTKVAALDPTLGLLSFGGTQSLEILTQSGEMQSLNLQDLFNAGAQDLPESTPAAPASSLEMPRTIEPQGLNNFDSNSVYNRPSVEARNHQDEEMLKRLDLMHSKLDRILKELSTDRSQKSKTRPLLFENLLTSRKNSAFLGSDFGREPHSSRLPTALSSSFSSSFSSARNSLSSQTETSPTSATPGPSITPPRTRPSNSLRLMDSPELSATRASSFPFNSAADSAAFASKSESDEKLERQTEDLIALIFSETPLSDPTSSSFTAQNDAGRAHQNFSNHDASSPHAEIPHAERKENSMHDSNLASLSLENFKKQVRLTERFIRDQTDRITNRIIDQFVDAAIPSSRSERPANPTRTDESNPQSNDQDHRLLATLNERRKLYSNPSDDSKA
jgi:hypothetical protein